MLANEQFRGPIHFSCRVSLQDGDQSANSHSNESFLLPEKNVQNNKSNQDADISVKGSKLSIKKLIGGKRLLEVFINNLLDRSYKRKLSSLTSYQIQQIDDLQMDNPGPLEQKMNFSKIIEVFTPYNKFIVFWHVFQILTYLLIFFWLPYKISFETHRLSKLIYDDEHDNKIEIIILVILSLDSLVSMNTAFIQKGHLIKTRRIILMHYFNSSALLDLISFLTISISFFTQNPNQENQMILIQGALCFVFYILRIAKINKILASILEFFNLSGYLNDLVGLFKVLMVIVGVVHIFGCIWHGIAFYNSSYSWLDAYELRHKSNVSRYNVAIYWATMTMTTVGYGDITAKNDLELLFNNLTMFLGSIVFAYSVNSIGIFVTNMYKGTIEYSKTVSLINTFMSKNKIPFELQTKIRSYLEYIWQEEQNMNDDEVGLIINKLSKNLQEEIQYQLRGNILKQCKILNKLFSESFLKSLLPYLDEQSFSPEEKIFSMGIGDDCALYFITKGEVSLIFEGEQMNEKIKRNTLKTYFQYDSFGEVTFLTGNYRTLTAISNGFTRVMKLKREYFLSIIKSFPDDYERYCDLRDKASFNDYQKLEQHCFSCQSIDHMIENCNFVHFCADREKVIKKELYPVTQERFRFQRKNNLFNQHTLIALKQIAKSADRLNQDLLKKAQEDDSRLEEQDEERFEENENQINRKSVSESLLQNIEQFDLQNQKNRNRPKLIFTQGLEKVVEKDSNSGNVQKSYSSSVDVESLDKQDQMQPQSPNNNLTQLRISIVNSRNLQQLQERKKSQRQSLEIEGSSLRNQLKKLEIDSVPNVLQSFQMRKTMLTNNQTLIENQLDSLEIISTILQDFEKMQRFTYYSPFYNIDGVIRRYCKLQKGFNKKKPYPDSSLYSFSQVAIKKAWKLRRLSLQARSQKTTQKKDLNTSQRIFFTQDIN